MLVILAIPLPLQKEKGRSICEGGRGTTMMLLYTQGQKTLFRILLHTGAIPHETLDPPHPSPIPPPQSINSPLLPPVPVSSASRNFFSHFLPLSFRQPPTKKKFCLPVPSPSTLFLSFLSQFNKTIMCCCSERGRMLVRTPI